PLRLSSLTLLGIGLVALAAYSAGAVLAARGRAVAPLLPDLVLALACAAGAGWLAMRFGRLPGTALGLLLAMAAGAAGDAVRARGSSRFRPAQVADGKGSAWRRFLRRMGNFQGRMILGLFYFVLLAPFALVVRLRPDPLAAVRGPDGSFWRPRAAADDDLARARRQS
ncbi:MAG TPA: hypothetical protein VFH27_00710, partial [Longimicrobiaceae bacterium]|nr:hypothetical protein [Longimicrobiaceae bacterium]